MSNKLTELKNPQDQIVKNTALGIIKNFYTKHKKIILTTLSVIFVLLIIGLGVIGVWAANIWTNNSSVDDLGSIPAQSSIVYASDGQTELFRFFEEENRETVELNQISPNMQEAIIALEDENFWYNESGIPWSNIAGATAQCVLSVGDNCRGGSGLSQQLIKNVRKDNEGTIERKVRELFTAIKLNQSLSKQEIMQDYLNWVPFGRNAYGVKQAASTYFNKQPSELNPAEACYLASMVQRPSYFSAGISNPESNAWKLLQQRKDACLSKMFELDLDPNTDGKAISSAEELENWKNTKISFQPRGKAVKYAHFRDYVTEQLENFVDPQELLTGGYKIVTTLDVATQEEAEKIMTEARTKNINPAGGNNGAMLVLDGPTGGIVAMVGSVDYSDESIQGQVNVTTSPRQPGSTFKPYVYAAAMENGLNPGTVLLDTQTTFDNNYTPRNFSGRFSGPVTIRSSLQNSLNIPAVKSAILSSDSPTPNSRDGINQVFDLTVRAGMNYPCIPTADGSKCQNEQTASRAYLDRCGLSSALGGCEVTMISHLTALNTFAQEGNMRTATPFKEIRNAQGVDIYAQKQNSSNPVYPQIDRAINPLTARQIDSILSDYEARKVVFGNSSRLLELPGWTKENAVAAKTGTTNNNKDMWTVGFSPYYSVAVWAGNTDGKLMNPNSVSTSTTSTAWQKMMINLHTNKTKKGFSKEGLQSVKINPQTGLIDENGVNEWLSPTQKTSLESATQKMNDPNYKPTENNLLSNLSTVISRKLKINKVDGKLATEKTLPENIEEQTFLEVVAEYPAWKESADRFMQSNQSNYKLAPTEISDQDQVAESKKPPLISSNLDKSSNDIKLINAQAEVQGIAKSIENLEILINGKLVKSVQNQKEIEFDKLEEYDLKTVTVVIKARDDIGNESLKTYQNIKIKTKDENDSTLNQSDIQSLNINCTELKNENKQVDCEFKVKTGQAIPDSLKLRLGNTGDGKKCEQNNLTVRCQNISIPGNNNQEFEIQIWFNSNWIKTSSKYNNPNT